jgi:hypothetical protein
MHKWTTDQALPARHAIHLSFDEYTETYETEESYHLYRNAMKPKSPIIFIGMHRSGTSLVGRLLEGLGMYFGARKDQNNEAIIFQKLNHWLLRQSGAAWDVPAPFDYLEGNPRALNLVEDYFLRVLNGPRSMSYLGLSKYIRYRGLSALDLRWGWKDPRNTFTLPVWMNVFPNSKIVYIERHGVDVAQSLKVRRDAWEKRWLEKYSKRQRWYSLVGLRGRVTHSSRCATLEGAFGLWEEYVLRGRNHCAALGPERCFSLKYEQLIDEGQNVLDDLSRFCGLNASQAEIARSLKALRKARAYAYRSSPKLRHFAASVSPRLLDYAG